MALTHFETSLRLNPRDRTAGHLTGIAWPTFSAGGLAMRQQGWSGRAGRIPTWPVTYRFLASCYAHMDAWRKRVECLERLRAIVPVIMPNTVPLRSPEHRELFLSGLRLAAGEGT